MNILEIKRHLNKPDESYLCDLLARGNDYVILKYVSPQPGRVGSVTFEAGSTTFAYYKTGRGYVVWKMLNPGKMLEGHLFHICKDQQVQDTRVEYLDLLLDVWIDSEGQLTILDRDELENCAQKGKIGDKELRWIAHQELIIKENWRQIISDLDHLL